MMFVCFHTFITSIFAQISGSVVKPYNAMLFAGDDRGVCYLPEGIAASLRLFVWASSFSSWLIAHISLLILLHHSSAKATSIRLCKRMMKQDE
jgi:hypothetical protein